MRSWNKLFNGLSTGCNKNLTYVSYDIKKNHKNFERLELGNGLLYRKFFDDTGKVIHRQACIPEYFKIEVLIRIDNALQEVI